MPLWWWCLFGLFSFFVWGCLLMALWMVFSTVVTFLVRRAEMRRDRLFCKRVGARY